MLSVDGLLNSLYKLKPLLWPLLVGLSSAVIFYFQASRYSRLKPPESDDLKSSNKKNQLTVSMYANEVLACF
ncbi:hypothetical protein TOT_020000236 [Theileria orientalis strain Shintoku]|uniref:Uncharacterized protein n=1 Tax=Theileria orientalis strain Shintoku TaxID=869250 RepID=J4DP25_THEOR|nr:hypothetical protein TOT_020000236 [Theileria orientalis strain Shintoku]BAM39969.1 hypothetical protein TOT_020000236 [Theileria orientalis strain Shintoku]|eukprot:XP_009690270.1 hypothetical protein TOT_020000236 [Theileria orientalis strain Shintoku]